MSRGDFRVIDQAGTVPNAHRYYTKAGQTAIVAGEFVVQDASGDEEYVLPPSNGASNAQVWIGVALTDDTVTASADGEVWVCDDLTATFRGRPTTASNLAVSLINTQVTLDVASSVQTVDEDDTTNGTLRIVDVNADLDTIDVRMAALDHISEG